MPGLRFEVPTGAAADAKELEYIIALHQTSKTTRRNATVSSQDIKALLKSRYELSITHNQAVQTVRSLGGGDTEVAKEETTQDKQTTTHKRRISLQSIPKKTAQLATGFWENAVDFVSHPFRHSDGTQTEGDGKDETSWDVSDRIDDTVDDDADFDEEAHQNDMEGLKRMHAAAKQQEKQGIPVTNTTSMLLLQQKVVGNLREKVMNKAQSGAVRHLHVSVTSSMGENNTMSNGGESETHEIVFSKSSSSGDVGDNDESTPLVAEDSNEQSGGLLNDSTPPTASDDDDVFVSAAEIPLDYGNSVKTRTDQPQLSTLNEETAEGMPSLARFPSTELYYFDAVDWDNEDLEKDDWEPEYLDLVQVLSTIMLPNFSLFAFDTKHPPEEEEVKPEPTNVFYRLWRRVVLYGRRKLQLDNDHPPKYKADRTLELIKKTLFKAIPGVKDPVLDESLIQLILITHGEIERAMNPDLVREMLAIAQSPSGRLDDVALIHAVSSDLPNDLWDPRNEDLRNTFFGDVFETQTPQPDSKLKANYLQTNGGRANDIENADNSTSKDPNQNCPRQSVAATEISESVNLDEPHSRMEGMNGGGATQSTTNHVEEDETGAFVPIPKQDFKIDKGGADFVLDTQISFVILMLIWMSFILTTSIYGSKIFELIQLDQEFKCEIEQDFWCVFLSTVINWAALAIILSIFGMIFVYPISFGNSPSNRSWQWQLSVAFLTLVYTVPPYVGIRLDYQNKDESVPSYYNRFLTLNILVGSILAGMLIMQATFSIFVKNPQKLQQPFKLLASISSWNFEIQVHSAAKHKVDKMVSNAMRLHEPDDESLYELVGNHDMDESAASTEHVMRNFVLHGEQQQLIGGLGWVWWKILDSSLFEEEGLWINSRLRVIQLTQLIFCFFVTFIAILAVEEGAEAADEERSDLEEDESTPDWVMDYFPTGAMIRGAFFPAVIVGFVVMVFITALYIPSAIGTIFKFRSQIYPSLGTEYFERYRSSMDSTHMNMANALYGLLGMAVLIYVVIGGIIYLYLWPISRDFMLRVTAWGLGLGVTIGLKMALTMTCRMVQYRSFYRIRPKAARITSLALECWYIGLAASVLLARIGQFLFAAVFWVGRIDVPFLSQDVVLFGYYFDYVPLHFYKDLLVHEAHRHPYIERLTQMYLMKLRYGNRFISDAGSAWRQLLILAMFPWLRRYRVFGDERNQDAKMDVAQNEEMEEEEGKIYVGGVQKQVRKIGGGIQREVVDATKEVGGVGGDVLGAGMEAGAEAGRRGMQTAESLASVAQKGKPAKASLEPVQEH